MKQIFRKNYMVAISFILSFILLMVPAQVQAASFDLHLEANYIKVSRDYDPGWNEGHPEFEMRSKCRSSSGTWQAWQWTIHWEKSGEDQAWRYNTYGDGSSFATQMQAALDELNYNCYDHPGDDLRVQLMEDDGAYEEEVSIVYSIDFSDLDTTTSYFYIGSSSTCYSSPDYTNEPTCFRVKVWW